MIVVVVEVEVEGVVVLWNECFGKGVCVVEGKSEFVIFG